ncbi:MAG: 30S ribosomal protein S8 [Candidatus ainarchaeum sp.]|nr:30S ribosomal protein S8 [Candidatus ainarchaeum sp.]
MSMNDPIMNAFTIIRNAELASKRECMIKPASKFLGEILKIAKQNEYIEDYKMDDNNGIISYKINLNGKINTCKGIKPRFAVKTTDFEKYEKRYLPARDVGIIIVSTSQGVMTQIDAKKKGLGGRLVAFIY